MDTAFRQLPGRLDVWAPRAEHVELEAPFGRLALRRSEPSESSRLRHGRRIPEGSFHICDERLVAGLPYAFRLNGGEARPDPRSRHQPDGVHGRSRLVDPRSFPWSDATFRPPRLGPRSVIYELHVGTFTPEGTLDAARSRLDHLLRLGVTHLELMPVNAFPGSRGWGYDGVGLFAVQDAYGGPEALARFVDACHSRGLAVILDVVYNHLGPDGNYLGQFAPYTTEAHTTPWGPAINLDDRHSDGVRAFLVDNALQWLRDYHLDGLRLDAVDAFRDDSSLHIEEELRQAVDRLEREAGKHLCLIAEHDLADARHVRDPAAGGYGMDGQWCDDFHRALHAFFTGERHGYYQDYGALRHLADQLEAGYHHRGQWCGWRGRRHGRPDQLPPKDQLVCYVQTHDQVGNRPRGERFVHLVGPARARQAAALLFVSPFIPMLWQGEEWGASTPFCFFTDHHHGLGQLVEEGRRRGFQHFGWPDHSAPHPNDPATLERCRLLWHELEDGEHAALLEAHRQLIALRRSAPDLVTAPVLASSDPEESWLRVRRGSLELLLSFREGLRLEVPAAARPLLLWDAELVAGASSAEQQEAGAVVLGGTGVALIAG